MAMAQDMAPEVPAKWRAGIDISSPILLQFDNYAGWDRAMQLEGVLQYRAGRSWYFWPHLYAGYYNGNGEPYRGGYFEHLFE